ncbi:unnamed protein product [Rhizophagus irregularis]|nr:unnamed protein product [Rhizophagus irregularis]
MTSVKGWIEEKIKNEYIRYFEYNEFSEITEIGNGSFGVVNKAILANTGLVALKIIINKNSNELNEANDEIVKELKLLREVDYHPKINRCLGITKDSKNYILVMEYANEGNLRDFLNKKFTSLKWSDQIQMALDITSGLKFLHSKEIIHRDLHSKNILVNNGKLLIADLGLSKKLAEVTTNSLGDREDTIEGTPPKYKDLYQQCWDDEPKSRPNIGEVHEILSQLITIDPRSLQPNIHNIDDKSNSKVNDNDDLNISSDFSINTSAVPFIKFLPIIKEIENIFEEITELVKAAEHNKRTCKILKNRVGAAVRDLGEDRKEFFNNKNYSCLQDLSDTITRIKKFISEISQMKSLIKHIKVKNIEETFKKLCEEFDSYIKVLSFSIDVKTADELGQLKADQDDITKYLKEIVASIKLKLNYGLFLNGYSIEPSKQAIFTENGELNISLYEGQPLVYTFINDRNSRKNLLSFNSDDNDVELDEHLRPSDICINFPVAEITYIADLSESFSNFIDDDRGKLYEMYGHLFPKKVLIGGKLFIDGLKSVTSTQIDIFNSYLTWVYNSSKHKKETPFNNLSAFNFFPKILTLDGITLDTREKFTNWVNDLYRDDTVKIISYNNLIPISQLKSDPISLINEIQPGVSNFKEKLTLENWAKNSKYVRWVEEFQFLRGLIIDQRFELKISKENAIELINIPNIESSDKFYIRIVKPTTTLEEILINNHIFSVNNNEDISSSFPFIKVSDDPSYDDFAHFLVKCEQYKILLNRDNIKPSEKFKQAVEKALEDMKPLICLQEVFDEYGHFIPLNIILGKSLRNTIVNSSSISKKIDLASPVFESLKPLLSDYSINYLITQKKHTIGENELSEWIQDLKNELEIEIIESNNIIPLYSILDVEQTKRIDTILNRKDKFKIIMTGSIDLKDSDITKQVIVSIEPSLDNKNYEVFGSIVSKNNSKLDDIFVTFGLYEINEFFVTIDSSKNTNISIEGCYIIWMIIGNPLELSVFYPNNREIQVDYFKETITLQRDNPIYSIQTSHQLSQGYDISIKCFEPINIKLIRWSKNCIYLNISNSSIDFNSTQSNVEVTVCTLSHSDRENTKIDINGKKYSMGYILTENNHGEEPQLKQTNIRRYIDNQYPIKGELNELIMLNNNLEGHLDLSDFINLEKLQCSNNKLTSLDISKNEKLTVIDCSQNNLIRLDLSNCLNIKSVTANHNQLNELKLPAIINNDKLEYLNLLDNSFSQNLNCFSRLVNLKELFIGNTDEDRIKQGIYNRFYGSLKPLKLIIKLENLCINDTDIDSGLEYLPDSIKSFQCSVDKRPEAKVVKIYEQLKTYSISSSDALQGRYNLKVWKKNWKLIKQNEAIQNQIKQVEEELKLDAQFTELEKEESNLIAKEDELVKKNINLEEKKYLEDLVKKLNEKLEQTKQQLEEKEKKLESFTVMEKEVLHKEMHGLIDELAIKEEKVSQSEKQLEETTRKLKAKEDESTNLKNELENIRSSLSQIEHKKVKLNNLRKKLDNEKSFTKTDASGLRNQMDDLKKEIQLLQNQAVKAKEIENELEKIKRNRDVLRTEQNSQQDFIIKLQRDKSNLEEELKTRKYQLNYKQELINKIMQQNEEKINALSNELEEKEELINKLKQQNEEKTNVLKNKECFIDELQQQTYELKRQLNEETEKYQNFQGKIKDLLSQIQTQQVELSELVNNFNKKHEPGKKGMLLVNNILEKQRNVIQTNDNSASEELEKIRQKLINDFDLPAEEIQDILYKQAEKTKLDMQFKTLIN